MFFRANSRTDGRTDGQRHTIIRAYKNSANKFSRKTGFKIKNEIEDHYQSIPKLTGMLTELRCIIGQNLEILTSTGGEWSCGQDQNCVNFDFQVKFDLEGQGQSTPKTIGILTMCYMSGSNLVILAGTSDKLSRGQARDWRPHGQTQATTIPEGQNWPWVKNCQKFKFWNFAWNFTCDTPFEVAW